MKTLKTLTLKVLPYLVTFHKYVSVPVYFVCVLSESSLIALKYLVKYNSLWLFIGSMLFFNVLGLIGSICLYRIVPKDMRGYFKALPR